jgi:phosphohistidine phosphatase
MLVYLVRHAKATRSSPTGRDEDRPLAPKGLRQAAWLGERLAGAEAPPERLLCSPAARTMQTARLLGEALGLDAQPEPALGLDSRASKVVDLIGSFETGESVALVGHNPTISLAVEALVRGPGGRGGVELRTGQAALVEIPEPGGPMGDARLLGLWRMDG